MKFPALIATLGALSTPLAAQEMTDAERESFRAEVRAYLLENPEVIREAITVLEARQAEEARQQDNALVAANADALFETPTSYVGGNPDGDVTVVEFLDYRCGYCKRAHPEIAALLAGDANIRYVIKEFPILGEESVLASRYALAVQDIAGDDTYFDVHNTLMEFEGNFTDASLARVSDAFGLDHDAIAEKMGSEEVTAVIYENRLLAQKLAISGTPSFVFQDEMVRGYIPLPQMEAIVEAARSADG